MMASLAELTDNPFVQNTIDSVALRDATDLPKTRIIVRPQNTPNNEPVKQDDSKLQNIIDQLFGLNGKERYQLWPEKLVRDAISAPHDVMTGEIPQYVIDPVTGEAQTSPQMIKAGVDASSLAGSGGLAGAGSEAGVALGSAPFLRPALKYGEKLYKGKPGQQHMDVIPQELYPTFQKQAMSGEDISNFNFGFLNHKGQFLSREDALKYAIDNGLVDPHSAQYGALTSTLMSDSAKPGAIISTLDNIKYGDMISKQRGIEGYSAAVRDPVTKKIYSDGTYHSDIINNISDPIVKNRLMRIYNNVENHDVLNTGFIDAKGKYLTRPQMEKRFGIANADDLQDFKPISKTAMFRSDTSKPGTAINALAKAGNPEWNVKGFENSNWFHGTTHDFDKFSMAKGNPENHLGKYPHFSSSPRDASANYAGHGPDLTSRIENRAEEIAQSIANKKYGGVMGDNYGKIMTEAKNKAIKELAGPHEGAVIPANLKLNNPISLVDSKPTWLDFAPKMNKDGDIVGDSALAVKFYNSLKKQGEKYNFNPDDVMASVGEHLYDMTKASDLDKALRNSEALMYVDDNKGRLVSSDIISNIYKDLGFDGIVMDAKAAFPHMKDIPEGTLHAAPLKRNTVQSKLTGKTLFSDTSKPGASIQDDDKSKIIESNGKKYKLIHVDHNPFESK